MKTERQQDQDVAERLRRENLERVEAGGCAPPVLASAGPKDNEVDEKVPCHRIFSEKTGYWGPWRDGPIPEFADPSVRTETAYSAATVAELRAEVERLSEQLRYVADACEHETARADAAERRVGELEAALRDLISVADPVALAPREYERIREQTARGTCISISIDPFPLLKCRYEDVVDLTDGLKRARAALTGADPT